MTPPDAPAWSTERWFNTDAPLTLDALRGRVVMLYAFQMLCPGCVSHGIPQAQRVAREFADAPVTVVGLHTVFEHHAVMGPEASRCSSTNTACGSLWPWISRVRRATPSPGPCAPTRCAARQRWR